MKRGFKIILNISLIFLILICFMFCCPLKTVQADDVDNVMNAGSDFLNNGKNQVNNVWSDDDFDLLNTSIGNFFYTMAVLIVAIIDLGLLGFYLLNKAVGNNAEGEAKLKKLLIIILVTNIIVVGFPLIGTLIMNIFNNITDS